MLAIATLSAPAAQHDVVGLEPGIFSLFSRVLRGFSTSQDDRNSASASALIEANGGLLTDDVERQIAVGFVTGRF